MVPTNKFLRSVEVIKSDSVTEGLKDESHTTYLFNGKKIKGSLVIESKIVKTSSHVISKNIHSERRIKKQQDT